MDFPWLLTRIHIIKPSPNHSSFSLIQSEDSREIHKRDHNMLPFLTVQSIDSVWPGEVRQYLQEIKSGPEEHTQLQPDLYHFTYGKMT